MSPINNFETFIIQCKNITISMKINFVPIFIILYYYFLLFKFFIIFAYIYIFQFSIIKSFFIKFIIIFIIKM